MLGFYYLLSLVAFGVIARWLIENDLRPPGERTTGWLRMKEPISHEANTNKNAERSVDMPH